MRGRRRGRASAGAAALPLVAALASGACPESGPTAPSPVPATPSDAGPERVEFNGIVQEAFPGRSSMRPVPGVAVTLTGGQVHGRTSVTDSAGRFSFADYPACERGSVECRVRRIQVEKPGYEARAESLSDPYRDYAFSGRREWRPDYREIVMGHKWPRDPQFDRLRAQVPAMQPLYLVLWDAAQWPTGQQHGGEYSAGFIAVLTRTAQWIVHRAITHEYCHAHQDWVVDPNDYGPLHLWERTSAGRAFQAAEVADKAAGNYVSSRYQLYERAATICEIFYYEIKYPTFPRGYESDRAWLRENAPHQYAWAAEWLQGFGGFQEPATLAFRRGGR